MSFYGLRFIQEIPVRKLSLQVLLIGSVAVSGCLAGYVASSGRFIPELESSGWQYLILLPAVVLCLVIAAAVVRWPEASSVLLIAVAFGNLSEVGVRYHSLPSILQWLLGLLLAGLVVRCMFYGLNYLRFDPLLIVMVLFVGFVFASSTYAPDPRLADEQFLQHVRGLVILFVLINLLRNRESLDAAVWALIIAAGIISGIAAFQVVTSSYDMTFGGLARVKNAQIVENVFEPRVSGTLSDPNFFAQILLIVIPLALYRFWDATKLFGKMVAGGAFALINIALVFTYSRGAILAAAIVYLFAAIHRRLSFQFLIIAAIAALAFSLILPTEALKRIDTLTQLLPGQTSTEGKIDTSFQERTLLMKTAVEMFRDNMLLGVGAGNYTNKFDEYARLVGSNVSSYEGFDKQRFPHSLYLETGAELGLVGLSLLIFIGIVAIYYTFRSARVFREMGDRRTSNIAFGIGLSIVGYGLTSLFLHGDYVQYLWLLAALAIVCKKLASTETRPAAESMV